METVSEPRLKPWAEWKPRVETANFRSLLGPKRRMVGVIGWRRCPHGIEHVDRELCDAIGNSAYMFVPDPCQNEHCKREAKGK